MCPKTKFLNTNLSRMINGCMQVLMASANSEQANLIHSATTLKGPDHVQLNFRVKVFWHWVNKKLKVPIHFQFLYLVPKQFQSESQLHIIQPYNF